ncbi:hypothetical protein J415_16190 [Klebsiella michiganensis HKOPL1]|uniref:Uncharacterized protein n=1 Tax=Klebsiella michiganensis (strain ATCC 8724 / DSM 4798 / JCM 20051 / NBRC 3318 / NRRL B-199 / KCTC 1686 / BUCSAV 143 / CCM 1901) TaxID=1006551 RepID=A0A0H3HC23_KLEM8|nr:hypothetical protein KOX_21400 [Klebsiella michiganensis KCTC 1686]AHW88702.1 hypothetical protein J415_16190 [Klebsiella michiganensis HKOPL1]
MRCFHAAVSENFPGLYFFIQHKMLLTGGGRARFF